MVDPRRAFQLMLRIFLRQAREGWGMLAVVGVVMPLLLVSALDATPFIVASTFAGSSVALGGIAALLGVALLALPVTLAGMRERGEIGYFAGLPVGQGVWLTSLASAYGIVAVGCAAVVALGAMVPAHQMIPISLWALPLVALVGAAFVAVGACVGLLARSSRLALAAGCAVYLTLVAGMLLFALTPHLASQTRLLVALAPSSLASDAFAACLPGGQAHALFADVVFLLIYAGAAGYLASRLVPWRVVGHHDVVAPKAP